MMQWSTLCIGTKVWEMLYFSKEMVIVGSTIIGILYGQLVEMQIKQSGHIGGISFILTLDCKNESEFAPYDYVTREELSKVLSNTYYLINQKAQFDDYICEYADQEKISCRALKYVGNVRSLNIMIGNPNNEFKPYANVTKKDKVSTHLVQICKKNLLGRPQSEKVGKRVLKDEY